MNINQLILKCSDLDGLESFYRNFEGLEMIRAKDCLYINLCSTELIFEQSDTDWTYHYAVNIPWGSIDDAVDWLSDQDIDLLPFQGEEIVEFPSWNARAIYFYDAADNVVEWISRKDVSTEYNGEFSPRHLLHVSEIGTPVLDVEQSAAALSKHTGIKVYSGPSKEFAAVGDEYGLFILVDAERKTWMPQDDEIKMSPYTMEAIVPSYPEGMRLEYRAGTIEF